MQPVTVEKIGGTSMSRFPEILKNVILREPSRIYGRVYIVSAYAGVTNLLLEHKKTGEGGVYVKFAERGDYASALQALKRKLFQINEGFVEAGLPLALANRFIEERVDGALEYLRSMNNVLASGYLARGEVLSAARELLASIGESHAAYNSALMLEKQGYRATVIDLSGWGDARELTIDERVRDAFTDARPSDSVMFVTGYCKGTEGIMREFDRGYSEVTFSKVAVALNAAEAVIHKEFHLSSADPTIVEASKVQPVCNTNFDVADQLADVGMEAIHPKASKPLELQGIALRVRNAFDSEHDGTLITKDYICPDSKIEVVTGSNKVSILEIHDTRMVAEVGSDYRIMEVLVRNGVSYIGKSTNANTIDLVVWDRDVTDAIVGELRAMFDSVTVRPVAIVCAIGSNIAKPGILARAAKALADAGVNIINVAQTARQTNMQFSVGREDFVAAQRALHRELCE
jgi:aspartate kinase